MDITINPSDEYVKIYSGRPGCMCGCKGNYTQPASRGFKRVLSNMIEFSKQNATKLKVDISAKWIYIEADNKCYCVWTGYN